MKAQFGRSMVEMLGVLAIIGVISIGGFWGYRVAMDKHAAGKIIHDVQVYHMALDERGIRFDADGYAPHTDFIAEAPYEYAGFESQTGAESGYWEIDVETVTKGVCKALLEKTEKYDDGFYRLGPDYVMGVARGPKGLLLYDGDTDICQNENTMIFIIGDAEKLCSLPDTTDGKERSCSDGCLCPKGTHDCKTDQFAPNWPVLPEEWTVCCPKSDDADEIACNGECINKACPENMTFSRKTCSCVCTDPTTMIYDTDKGHCVVSNGACSYTMAESQTQTKTSNCSYSMATAQTQAKTSNCRYTISGSGENVSVTAVPGYGCTRPGEYCYLAYADVGCNTPLESNATGTLYGTCIKQNTASSQCYITAVSETLTPVVPCPAAQYCYLKWADSDCETPLESNATGTLHGACIAQGSNSVTTCPPSTQ